MIKAEPENACKLRRLIRQIFTHYSSPEPGDRILYDAACHELVYLLVNSFLAPKNDAIWNLPTKGSNKRKYDLMRYISENYTQDISLSDLADHFHLTPPYLSKYFKDYFGTTFSNYLRSIRLEHALQDMLSSDKSLSVVAYSHGFPNMASFTKSFKEVYNTTPNAYRQQHQKEILTNVSAPTSQSSAADTHLSVQVHNYLTESPDEIIKPVPKNREHLRTSVKASELPGGTRLNKPWQKLLILGSASQMVRYDVREQLKFLTKRLPFEYIYLSNLLHPSMDIFVNQKNGKYNFSEIKKALDYVLSLGLRPYIELETQEIIHLSRIDEHVLSGDARSSMNELHNNYSLFDSLLTFLLRRYGREEVSHWYFSIERSTAKSNYVDYEAYFRYFSSIYFMIKRKIPDVKIGGPGFTIDFSEDHITDVLNQWVSYGCSPDFINFYIFPYVMDESRLEQGRSNVSTDENHLSHTLDHLNIAMQKAGLQEKELHVTLWNSSLSSSNVLNDSCLKAAYVMNNLINSRNQCAFLGYNYALDACAGDIDHSDFLFGGTGLIGQNEMKKPVYHVYRFLDRLLPYTLKVTPHAIVTTDHLGRYAICCHNYKHYNYLFYQKREEKIQIEEISDLYIDHEPLQLTLILEDMADGDYQIRKRIVNDDNGNVQSAWLTLDRQSDLNEHELNYLRAKAEPGLSYKHASVVKHTLFLEENLKPQEILLIEIEYLE